jgi:acetyltransferase-like isoleucine patch superfamily enzyme
MVSSAFSLPLVEKRSSLVIAESAVADPEDIARKVAANPKLKIPAAPQWVLDADGRVVDRVQEGVTTYRSARNYLAAVFYNSVVTHIPVHAIRQGYLRLFGATIGKDTAIMRGTTVWDIEYLTIGDRTCIGSRSLLDGRAGLAIGDDVVIASDTHILCGGHDVNDPNFLPVTHIPIVIEDYVWIASRAMILPSHIRRGAVVGAHAVVNKDVGELEMVGGVPAKLFGKRDPNALKYSGKFKPILG